jgi:hypothetical protein
MAAGSANSVKVVFAVQAGVAMAMPPPACIAQRLSAGERAVPAACAKAGGRMAAMSTTLISGKRCTITPR